MLKVSRYNERERVNNIKGAVQRHRQMLLEVQNGERESMYRKREQIVQCKDLKGGLCAASWFLNKEINGVITCQATPGSKLADTIRKEIGTSPDGSKRLVMEEGGVPLTLGLKKTDPRPTEGCQFGDSNCWVEGNKCSTMNSIYCITCNE